MTGMTEARGQIGAGCELRRLANLGRPLKSEGQFDMRGLLEGPSEEGNPDREAANIPGRNRNVRVTGHRLSANRQRTQVGRHGDRRA
jgi:hypothetical protein